jgi:hypothetical protein
MYVVLSFLSAPPIIPVQILAEAKYNTMCSQLGTEKSLLRQSNWTMPVTQQASRVRPKKRRNHKEEDILIAPDNKAMQMSVSLQK